MSKEEKKQLYSDFKKSGMSISEYCKNYNISIPVLRGLQTYYENKLSNNEFVAVKADNDVIEFYVNNLKFKFKQEQLSKLLRGLFL